MKLLKYFVAIIAAGIAIALYSFLSFQRAVSMPASSEPADKEFMVVQGQGVSSIMNELEKQGFIRSRFFSDIYVRLSGDGSKIKAGRYNLSTGNSLKQTLDILAAGKALSEEIEIRIIPGWNIKDIDSHLKEKSLVEGSSFLDLAQSGVGDWRFNFPQPAFLSDAPRNAGLEGYLFPDTYRVFKDSSPEDIIEKLLSNLDTKFTQQMIQDAKDKNKTTHEIMTMASIIEKEVRSSDDMKLVAGIFYNRLEDGQALESCATLAYILGVNKPQYSYEDTMIDSPYNTYKNTGLPPGPIASPSFPAIMAAIYPADTEYNFFLTDSVTGETVFSRTYSEHLENKAKHLD